MFNKHFFPKNKHVDYDIIWENMVRPESSQNLIQGVPKLVTKN